LASGRREPAETGFSGSLRIRLAKITKIRRNSPGRRRFVLRHFAAFSGAVAECSAVRRIPNMSFRRLAVCLSVVASVGTGCASTDPMLAQQAGNQSPQRSPVQRAAWPGFNTPARSVGSDGTEGVRPASFLAPLQPAIQTLQIGTGQLQTGAGRVWQNTTSTAARGWENTKRLLTPPAFAPSPDRQQPSMWQRLFAPQPSPPQTTREFLALERPKWGS